MLLLFFVISASQCFTRRLPVYNSVWNAGFLSNPLIPVWEWVKLMCAWRVPAVLNGFHLWFLETVCLQECDSVESDKRNLMFQRPLSPLSSGLKGKSSMRMVLVWSSESRLNLPDDTASHTRRWCSHNYRFENLKSFYLPSVSKSLGFPHYSRHYATINMRYSHFVSELIYFIYLWYI
jgi:hypothetical protein